MKENKVSKGWKTTAIIFIVLFLMLGTIFAVGIFASLKNTKLVEECAIGVCGYSVYEGNFIGEYDNYYYDESSTTCYCFTGNDLKKEVVLD